MGGEVVVAIGPDVDAAGVKLFAAQAVADILGEVKNASFDVFPAEIFTLEDVLAADGFNTKKYVVNLDAA